MAKKDKKKKGDKAGEDPLAALRAFLERTLSASAEGAQSTRERTREIVDEIAATAKRVRETLEDVKVLDEVRKLRAEVEALASRVSRLELRPKAAPEETATESATTAATKPTAKKRAATKRKPAAKKRAASKRKPAAKRAAAKKPAAAKAKAAAAAKPAESKPAAAAEPKPEASKPAPSTGSS